MKTPSSIIEKMNNIELFTYVQDLEDDLLDEGRLDG